MTAFSFNLQGYVFQQGVQVLLSAYETAADALTEALNRAHDDKAAYLAEAAIDDTAWIGERDEEGHVIWDQEQVHDMEIEAKAEALEAVKKAFVISVYHHWERSARIWTGNDHRDHARLVKSVERLGYPISPRLHALRDLANLLKHDNDKRGADLFKSWPAVLPSVHQNPERRTNWYEAVRLKNQDLTDVFNIVAASGPNEKILPSSDVAIK